MAMFSGANNVLRMTFRNDCLKHVRAIKNPWLRHEGSRFVSTEAAISANYDQCPHVPVMAKEVVKMLQPQDGQVVVDMTFGSGGHTKHILESAKDLTIYALDRDPVAFQYAKELADKHPRERIVPLLGRFSDVEELLERSGVQKETVDSILFDVGVSSMQLRDYKRGFALSSEGPLDMRMDGDRIANQPAAYDVVNNLDELSLTKLLRVYGEETLAKPIARAIVEARYMFERITTTKELAQIIASVSNRERTDKIGRPAHLATKTFQALRIFVNNELNELNYGIEIAREYLRPGGRLIVLTFHSLEDRIVKRHFKGIDMDEAISSTLTQKYKNASTWHTLGDIESIYSNLWTPINKQVMVPTEEEVAMNPRSRSAKLRAAIKN